MHVTGDYVKQDDMVHLRVDEEHADTCLLRSEMEMEMGSTYELLALKKLVR